jgi:hypothetical protein
VLALLILSCLGCSIDWQRHRAFADEPSTVQHFQEHRDAFRELAVKWLANGHELFCTFGPDDMHWGAYGIDKTILGWTVTYSTKDGWAEPCFGSKDQAARKAETTAHEFESWQHQLLALSVERIEVVPITYRGKTARYVQLALPPPVPGYGFRFAPSTEAPALEALTRWASIPPPHGMRAMRVIGSGWFLL